MPTTGYAALDSETRKKGAADLKAFASEGGVRPNFFEEQKDLTMKSLKETAVTKSKAAAARPGDLRLRLEANHAVALYRDSLCSLAGRRMLQATGVHYTFRSLYEGSKVHVESAKS